METIAIYLLKSSVWLTGFALVFLLFLRNEKYFILKRVYLLSGLGASFLLPLVAIRYYVDLPADAGIAAGNAVTSGIREPGSGNLFNVSNILTALYLAGVIAMVAKAANQSRVLISSIKSSGIQEDSPVRLIRTPRFAGSFSFFSWVFVNPSVSDVETREIVNHELVHIREKHWADLTLAELLCIIQWFNPFVWMYIHFIRQNHEYLADRGALQSSSDPSVYRAALLNQIAGYPIFSLSNTFSYSLTKKRFNMMKNTIISPYRKFRLLLILPVLAGLLYAFAKPVYRLPAGYENVTVQPQDKVAKGVVVNQKGEPLSGAAVIAQGTTIGTVTDAKGNFALGKFPPESALVITYVGYTGKVVKPNYNELMKIIMVRDTINAMGLTSAPPPPPPPPPTDPFGSGKPPLVIIDGKVSNVKISDIPVETIESINVVKGETAVKKYGDKAKEGVIEITTKAPGETKVSSEKVYMMSEEMPSFPGGHDEMLKWMMVNFKYPEEAKKKGIQGQVIVSFEVAATGKLANVKAERSVHPLLDGEAVRLVSSMPDWTPGKQNGKPVSIIMKLPVVFKLN